MWGRLAALAALTLLIPGCANHVARQTESPVLAPPASGPVDFQVVPNEITAGESALLKWRAPENTRIVIQEGTENRGPGQPIEWRDVIRTTGSGEFRVAPEQNTWYVMTCEGGETPYCMSATVHVVTHAAPQ
jgi:hypothetical protein